MRLISIMEASRNGTEALKKKEEVRITVEQEVIQSEGKEEIEGTGSMIARAGHQSLMAFSNLRDKVFPSKPPIIMDCRHRALQRAGIL